MSDGSGVVLMGMEFMLTMGKWVTLSTAARAVSSWITVGSWILNLATAENIQSKEGCERKIPQEMTPLRKAFLGFK